MKIVEPTPSLEFTNPVDQDFLGWCIGGSQVMENYVTTIVENWISSHSHENTLAITTSFVGLEIKAACSLIGERGLSFGSCSLVAPYCVTSL